MRKQRKSLSPILSIWGRRNTINIGIDVIRLLGEPTHVCIMKNIHNYFPPFCERHRWGHETRRLTSAF